MAISGLSDRTIKKKGEKNMAPPIPKVIATVAMTIAKGNTYQRDNRLEMLGIPLRRRSKTNVVDKVIFGSLLSLSRRNSKLYIIITPYWYYQCN